jgi:hypothetical protein
VELLSLLITSSGLITTNNGVLANITTAGTNDILNMCYDTRNGIRFSERYIGVDDVRYDLIQKVTNVDKTSSLTFYNGNVGIGRTDPTNIFQVGSGNKLRIANNNTDHTIIGTGESPEFHTRIILFGVNGTDPSGGGTAGTGNILYLSGNGGGHMFFNQTLSTITERMRIGNNGNVAIGTTDTATYKLNVNGSINTTSILIGGSTITPSKWSTTPSTTNIFYNSGNVGIGVTNPVYKLHFKSTYDSIPSGLHIDSSDTTDPNKFALTIYPYVIAGGEVGYKFRTQSFIGGTNTPLTLNNYGNTVIQNNLTTVSLTSSGTIQSFGVYYFANSVWHKCNTSNDRFYFAPNATTYIKGYGDPPIVFRNGGDATLIYIYSNGYTTINGRLGIGGYPASYDLDIPANGVGDSGGDYVRYFNYDIQIAAGYTYLSNVSVRIGGSLWVGSWIASSSDSRIKEDIEDINDDTVLNMILAIEPKTYKYIDKVAKGDKKVYGFIAQQIKEVLPDAVGIQPNYIPNIMLLVDYDNEIITLPSQPTKIIIKLNDKIRCYDKDNKIIDVEVLEIIDDLTFKIKEIEYTDNKIFVSGTEVDDFHTISKEYIFTLNVCATQELHRRIISQEERIKELETKMQQILNNI